MLQVSPLAPRQLDAWSEPYPEAGVSPSSYFADSQLQPPSPAVIYGRWRVYCSATWTLTFTHRRLHDHRPWTSKLPAFPAGPGAGTCVCLQSPTFVVPACTPNNIVLVTLFFYICMGVT